MDLGAPYALSVVLSRPTLLFSYIVFFGLCRRYVFTVSLALYTVLCKILRLLQRMICHSFGLVSIRPEKLSLCDLTEETVTVWDLYLNLLSFMMFAVYITVS